MYIKYIKRSLMSFSKGMHTYNDHADEDRASPSPQKVSSSLFAVGPPSPFVPRKPLICCNNSLVLIVSEFHINETIQYSLCLASFTQRRIFKIHACCISNLFL